MFKKHPSKRNIYSIKSNFALHLINENHNYLNENMIPIHFFNNDRHLDTLEEYEIYKVSKHHKNRLVNDHLTFRSNKLYDTLNRQ